MDRKSLERHSDFEWWIRATGQMRVPGIIYAGEQLIEEMDDKVREQITNVATLPGIQRASYAMPDAHWGYGFPIGGVAAFDPDEGGVISAGGVGFDISCENQCSVIRPSANERWSQHVDQLPAIRSTRGENMTTHHVVLFTAFLLVLYDVE